VTSFSETLFDTEGEEIWWHHGWRTVTGCSCQAQSEGLLQMLSLMAQSLDSLHQATEELLWRRQHGIEGKCSYCENYENYIYRKGKK
jgi:hypothetical protein